jgi:hypothetical protein
MQKDLRNRRFPLLERVERITQRDKIPKELFNLDEDKPKKYFTKLNIKKERKER